MSHHNFEPPSQLRELFPPERDAAEVRDLIRLRQELLGATGRFPDGRYGTGDEGEIRFDVAAAAAAVDRKVIVNFGKPVRTLGLTLDQAAELADALTAKVWECRGVK